MKLKLFVLLACGLRSTQGTAQYDPADIPAGVIFRAWNNWDNTNNSETTWPVDTNGGASVYRPDDYVRVRIRASNTLNAGTSCPVQVKLSTTTNTRWGPVSCVVGSGVINGDIDDGGEGNIYIYAPEFKHANIHDFSVQIENTCEDALLVDQLEVFWSASRRQTVGIWGKMNIVGWCMCSDPSKDYAFHSNSVDDTCGEVVCFQHSPGADGVPSNHWQRMECAQKCNLCNGERCTRRDTERQMERLGTVLEASKVYL